MDNSEKSFLLSTESLTPPVTDCESCVWACPENYFKRGVDEEEAASLPGCAHILRKKLHLLETCLEYLLGLLCDPRKHPSVRVSCGWFPLRGGHEFFRKAASNVPSCILIIWETELKRQSSGKSSPCTLFIQLNKTKQNCCSYLRGNCRFHSFGSVY